MSLAMVINLCLLVNFGRNSRPGNHIRAKRVKWIASDWCLKKPTSPPAMSIRNANTPMVNFVTHHPSAAWWYLPNFKSMTDNSMKKRRCMPSIMWYSDSLVPNKAKKLIAKAMINSQPKEKLFVSGPNMRCASTWRRSQGVSSMLNDCWLNFTYMLPR